MRRRDGVVGQRSLQARSLPSTPEPDIPLVHSTEVFWAGEILRDGKLQAMHCGVFDRNLVYFFALRPAYRSRLGASKSHQLTRFPFVFVLRPGVADPPFHVYPFDTGAAEAGAFAGQADPFVPLEDYALDSTRSAIAGHVAWAFETPERYYDGRLRRDLLADVPQHEAVTRGFFDIANMGRAGSNRHDRRASAIEVAVDRDVDLEGNVLFAIVPKQYLEDPSGDNGAALARLAELSIPVETYDWQPNKAPDEFQDEIADVAKAWFKLNGVL